MSISGRQKVYTSAVYSTDLSPTAWARGHQLDALPQGCADLPWGTRFRPLCGLAVTSWTRSPRAAQTCPGYTLPPTAWARGHQLDALPQGCADLPWVHASAHCVGSRSPVGRAPPGLRRLALGYT